MSQADKSIVPGGPETPRLPPSGTASNTDNPEVIARDIEQTRAHMTETLAAIEQRLNPTELREKAVEELHVVEVRVKEAVRDQIDETKEKVKEVVREQIDETKAKVKEELIEAKDTIKHEIQEAIQHAKQSLHDATIGKVEHMVRRANETVEETSDTIVSTIRANPVPAALVGIGLAWMFMNRRSTTRARFRSESNRYGYASDVDSGYSGYSSGGYAGAYDRDFDRYGDQYGQRFAGSHGYRAERQGGISESLHNAQDRAGRMMGNAQERVTDMANQARDTASHTIHQVRDAAGNTYHQVRDAAGNVLDQVREVAGHTIHQVRDTAGNMVTQFRDTAGNIVHQVSDRASAMAHQVSDRASQFAHQATDLAHRASDQASHYAGEARQGIIRAEQRVEETYFENPLAMGAVAMAVGTAVGLSLPHTRREDELLGVARDQLINKAQQAVHEALDTAHQYTGRAAEQVRGTLQEAQK